MESRIQIRHLVQGAMVLGIGLHDDAEADDTLASWPIANEPVGIALPDEPRFRALARVRPRDIAGLRIITLTGQQGSPEAVTAQSGPYHAASAGLVPGGGIIPGGIAALIQSREYCAFMPSTADSPWRHSIVGHGVIVRPLPRGYPRLVTSAAWLKTRDVPQPHHLAPVIAMLKAAYSSPVRL